MSDIRGGSGKHSRPNRLKFWKRSKRKTHSKPEEMNTNLPPSPSRSLAVSNGLPMEIDANSMDISVITMDSARGKETNKKATTSRYVFPPQAIPKPRQQQNYAATPLLPPIGSDVLSQTESDTRDSSRNSSSMRSMLRFRGSFVPDKEEITNEANKGRKNKNVNAKTNFLTRTKTFQSIVKSAFDSVDADKSGFVDRQELYSGLLLVQLKLGGYVGPAACWPLTRESSDKVFEALDTDNSGHLDEKEFTNVMILLCAQIFSRIIIQWSLTLLLIPIIAEFVVDCVVFLFHQATNQWDTYFSDLGSFASQAYNDVSHFIATLDSSYINGCLSKIAAVISRCAQILIGFIPESHLERIYFTCMSCLLSIIVVPYALFKIDACFKPSN